MGTHKHHIIPKHMGGSNDPSNLVELTVEEHAEAHRVLWETHGKWQDFLAWKALSGQITSDDLRRELARLSRLGRQLTEDTKNKIRKARALQVFSVETRQKMSNSRRGKPRPRTVNMISPETNLKRSVALKGRPKQKSSLPSLWKRGGCSSNETMAF